jgi:hypothetical protein
MGDGDDDPFSQIGPVIEVLSPKPAADPSKDAVVVGSSYEVACKVTQREGGAAVDTAHVVVEIYEEGTATPVVTEPASIDGVDQFKAKVALAAVPGGKIKVGCSAPDLGQKPQTGRALVSTFYDSGPVIEFSTLKDGTVVPLGNDDSPDVNIQFSVKPLELVEGDTGAAVKNVVLDIDGMEVEAQLDEKTNSYVYPLDFQTLFEGAPVTGAGITVTATNKRSPHAGTASKRIGLAVDGKGPVITIQSPLGVGGKAPIVGARVDVTLQVSDAESGVTKDPGKRYATIAYNSKENKYPIEAKANGVYTFTFFAAQFEDTANVTANIHIEDLAGNVGSASHTMRFDTVAPYLSLAPPPARGMHKLGNDEVECSGPFDMLGASPVDGQIVAKETRIRAMIKERATEVAGATEFWFAGVDDTTTKLLVMEGNGDPILIDKVGDDGVCDTAANGREIALEPIKPGGTVPGTADGGDVSDPPYLAACTSSKSIDSNAKTMCNETSELFYVPSQTIDKWPLIYGTNVTSGGVGCTGTSLDIQAEGGWVCLVAVAADAVGNVSFSRPIRVCRELHGGADCGANKQIGDILDPPSNITCTDGCQLPSSIADYDLDPYLDY